MNKKLSFRFKGNRNYVQGGDIFDAVDNALFQCSRQNVRTLAFHRLARHHLLLVSEDPGSKAVAEGNAIELGGVSRPFWLLESESPVVERYDYDEDAITRSASIEDNSISAITVSGYSVIEQIVALTKMLNYVRAPDVPGKWLFAQLRLYSHLQKNAIQYRIRQKVLLANRYSIQEIFLDNKSVGEIRFIVGNP